MKTRFTAGFVVFIGLLLKIGRTMRIYSVYSTALQLICLNLTAEGKTDQIGG